MANNNNFYQNSLFNLGLMLGRYAGQAADNRNREQMENAYANAINGGTVTPQQMAQNIRNTGNVTVGDIMRSGGNPQMANAVANGVAPQTAQTTPQMSREEILNANGSLLNANGMPILSQGGNMIMNDKLMYEHYLNQGQPQVAQKYADHANWVRQNYDVPEAYLQNGATASYADSQDYLNGKKLYQAIANQALQNTPQNVNPAQASPQVQQTAPTVNSNAMASPTTAPAVANGNYNFAAPTLGDITNSLARGGTANFLMGRNW